MSSFTISTFDLEGSGRENRIWICPYCKQENDYIAEETHVFGDVANFASGKIFYYIALSERTCHYCKSKTLVKGNSDEANKLVIAEVNCKDSEQPVRKCKDRLDCKDYMYRGEGRVAFKALAKCSGCKDGGDHSCLLAEKELEYRLNNPDKLHLSDTQCVEVCAKTYCECIKFLDLTLAACRANKWEFNFGAEIPLITPASFNDSCWVISIEHKEGTNLISFKEVEVEKVLYLINASEVFIYHERQFKEFLASYKESEG